MMDQDLKKLRNKQIVIQNIMYVLIIILIASLLIFVKSLKAFSFMAAVICLSSFIISLIMRKRGELVEIIVPSMKPLFDYEREKLGVEYWKLKNRQLVSQALLTVMMVFQGIITPNNSPIAYEKPDLYFLLPIALVMFLILNISAYFHIKKVDKGNTVELKGYANRTLLYGILGGIVLSGLIFIVIIASVVFMYD